MHKRNSTSMKKDLENFLEAMVAAFAPLPGPMVLEILGLEAGFMARQEGGAPGLRSNFTSFFLLRTITFLFSIRPLADWLTATKGHDFTVSVNDGHHVLAQRCFENLRVAKD